MLPKLNLNNQDYNDQEYQPLAGDWGVILLSSMAIILLFQHLWHFEQPSTLKIRQANQTVATYDINQVREIKLNGPLGVSMISINQGKVRFKQSPCHNQYCVHQGWLTHAGQVAICIPNQISIQLLGKQNSYDSLNY